MEIKRGMSIKRGMIFNLTEPAKSQPEMGVDAVRKPRPYIIVSNDACNNCSFYCNAAPLTTQPKKEERYYRVPFPKCDGIDRWVNVSNIVLVPTSMCNHVSYNPFLSRVALDDEDFKANLDSALMKQFGLTAHVEEVAEKTVETVTTEATQTAATAFNLPVNITISIAGYDTQSVTLSPVTATESTPVAEPVVETISEPVAEAEVVEKKEPMELTTAVIRKYYKAYDGDMTYAQIAAMCDTTIGRVYTMAQRVVRESIEARRSAAKAVAMAKTVKQESAKPEPEKKPKHTTPVNPETGRSVCYIPVSDEALKQCRVLGGTMTNEEVAKAVGVSKRTLSTRISEYLERTGGTKTKRGRPADESRTKTVADKPSVRKSCGREKQDLDEKTIRRARSLGGDLKEQELADILGTSVATIRRRISDIRNGVTGDCKLSGKMLNTFIITNSSMINGTMSNPELSKALNMSIANVERLVTKLRKEQEASKSTGKSKYKFMSLDTKRQFLTDCKSGKYKISQLLAKYGDYGINSSEHLLKIVKRLEKELGVGKK